MAVYDHWNKPEVLAPVGCPLVILAPLLVMPGAVACVMKHRAVRCERVSHVQGRNDNFTYRLENGATISGRFDWTYP